MIVLGVVRPAGAFSLVLIFDGYILCKMWLSVEFVLDVD